MKKLNIDSYKGQYIFELVDSESQIINHLKSYEQLDLVIMDRKIKINFPNFYNSLDYPIELVDIKEKTKSIHSLPAILEKFTSYSLNKKSYICVVGGATLQDLIATACNLYHRGISWLFIPTTGISQGDSCIGSKTSLDGENSKNQFGVFHPPKHIYVCKEFLYSLDEVEIISGLGDIIHYLMPYELVNKYLDNILRFLDNKKEMISLSYELSFYSMEIKSNMVGIDEFDVNLRNIFNFGHSFGHAIEKSSDTYIPHGIAVLIGMYMAIEISLQGKILPKNFKNQSIQLEKIINKIIEIYFFKGFSIKKNKFKSKLSQDKKNSKKDMARLILPVSLENSIWNYPNFKSLYGLNLMDISLDKCMDKLLFLENLEGIKLN